MKTRFIIIALSLAVLAGASVLWLDHRAKTIEAQVWRDLETSVPALELKPESTDHPQEVEFTLSPSGDLIGSIRLSDGGLWRFSFRSHHSLNRPDSYSVFSGPLGTFRVKGSYFCCEVMFPDGTPKTSDEFLAFLRRVHPQVLQVR